jgi:hypothetical protein
MRFDMGIGALLIATLISPWVAHAETKLQQFEMTAGVVAGSGSRELDDLNGYQGLMGSVKGRVVGASWRGWGRATFDVVHQHGLSSTDQRPLVRELALQFDVGSLTATVGRQKLVWGRADGLNPTNIFGWRDQGRAVVWEDDQYRGVDAMRLDWRQSGNGQWSAYLVPSWRGSLLPAALEQELRAMAPQRSDAVSSKHPAWALRYETQGVGIDASVTLARAADAVPYLQATGMNLRRRYGELTMLGADMAWSLDPWILRGEFAHLSREQGDAGPRGEDTFIVGAERELTENLIVNAQLLHSRYRSFLAPADWGVLAPVAMTNGVLFHQQRRQDTGIALNLTVRPDDQVGSLQFLLMGYRGGERLFRLRGEYPVGERSKLELLAERYHGAPNSSFDSLARNNGIWLCWTYTWARGV